MFQPSERAIQSRCGVASAILTADGDSEKTDGVVSTHHRDSIPRARIRGSRLCTSILSGVGVEATALVLTEEEHRARTYALNSRRIRRPLVNTSLPTHALEQRLTALETIL